MFHLTTVEQETYRLLQQLFTIEIISDQFALAGGTALALQAGHRNSIDLDFFCPYAFDVKELETVLASTPDIHFEYVNSNSRMLFSYINNIKCDFLHEPATMIEPFVSHDRVSYYSVKDIAAMKLHTICGRGKKKDFFDIYVLLRLYNWQTLLNWFVQKYDKSQLYFLWRSIIYFEDAEDDPEINGIEPYNVSWDEIKERILEQCSN